MTKDKVIDGDLFGLRPAFRIGTEKSKPIYSLPPYTSTPKTTAWNDPYMFGKRQSFRPNNVRPRIIPDPNEDEAVLIKEQGIKVRISDETQKKIDEIKNVVNTSVKFTELLDQMALSIAEKQRLESIYMNNVNEAFAEIVAKLALVEQLKTQGAVAPIIAPIAPVVSVAKTPEKKTTLLDDAIILLTKDGVIVNDVIYPDDWKSNNKDDAKKIVRNFIYTMKNINIDSKKRKIGRAPTKPEDITGDRAKISQYLNSHYFSLRSGEFTVEEP